MTIVQEHNLKLLKFLLDHYGKHIIQDELAMEWFMDACKDAHKDKAMNPRYYCLPLSEKPFIQVKYPTEDDYKPIEMP